MFRTLLRSAPVALTAVSALAFAGAPAAHAAPHGATTVVCHGGDIASGDYYELVVHGDCTVPDGAKVTVETQLYVTSGSTLNAITTGHVHVKGNVEVGRGAVLGLGCNTETNCATPTKDEVGGNINSDHATAVILHADRVKGDITTLADGPGLTCAPSAQLASIPNLGTGTPAYDDFEDNTVGGYITTSHLRSCWMGVIRNHVGTNILVLDDRTADPDGNEVVTNTVRGDLGCYLNKPAAQLGDSGGAPNMVKGLKLGECASL
ncbi:hypothetical protein [Streptacidiphilus neutrinimicus]|uniref:hypothetical protein n=1 Tax=Streptacidiphilus neutrinimicus TaxID=105420 RepID=UPI0005A829E9|nr:hypothetical protein [Streptacidiphilus neutrinimicus]